MDPRHPEQAISRMRELMKQYDRIEADMAKATTSAQLAQLEREGGLVVQEICLVAPRIHEAMMQTSRQRRHDLSRGVIVDMFKYKVPAGATGEEEGVVEKPVDTIGEENIGGESKSMEKSVEEYPKELEKYGPQIHDYNSEIIEESLKNIEKKTTTNKTTRKKKTTKKAGK